tara:strand:+ start:658 stop:990 length:333 start_codon:yes stop_codon:yes gene_type:complete
MALYFFLGTLTSAGQKLVHENHNLVVEATSTIQVDGANILGQYAVLGRYDYLMLVEADDNDAVARLSLEMGVRTGLHVETLPAIATGFLKDRSDTNPLDSLTSTQQQIEP